MEGKKRTEICNHHIEELNKKLAEIYSITEIQDYKDERKERKINILEEIDKLNFLEGAYSIIEHKGIPQGNTYEEYNKYLQHVREALKKYEKIKDEIEQKNTEEIENINLLIKSFKSRQERY